MGILEELLKIREEKEEEERENREEGERGEESSSVQGAKQQKSTTSSTNNSSSVQTTAAGIQSEVASNNINSNINNYNIDEVREYIRRGEMRFLASFPNLQSVFDTISYFAKIFLQNDLKKGQLKYNDYFDYLVEAWNTYREALLNNANRVAKIPKIETKSIQDKVYTMDDYKRDYLDTLQKKIKYKSVPVVEKKIDATGGEYEVYREGEVNTKLNLGKL